MAIMLLTRPQAASERFWHDHDQSGIRCVISPVLKIVAHVGIRPPEPWSAVILTSVSALDHYDGPTHMPAYVVGARTAESARTKGFDVRLTAPDAAALCDAWPADAPKDVVHIRGRYVAGDLAAGLAQHGVRVDAWTVYDQKAQPLSKEAWAALEGEEPVILPLFSPRSATILVEQLEPRPPQAPIWAVAISAAVADAAQTAMFQELRIAEHPNAKAMGIALVDLTERARLLEGGGPVA
ncbi:MAG: uroporphyrinogen-III synthase [Marinovum sp.]|nr:uroporphyrinogen-III synthase [Marinovum sp.]